MQKQTIICVLAFGLFPIIASSSQGQQWAIKADYTESCNCNPVCPCNFGSSPTLGFCNGNGLIEIKKGHYGDVQLDGIALAVTFRMGEWEEYYVSEHATDEQVKATEQLMMAFFKSEFFKTPTSKVLSFKRAPVSVERTADKIKFSTPASEVEIEMMKGTDGKPIKIQNLPDFADYTQYKSITNSHRSENEDLAFSYSGTNGLTSKMEARSKK